MHDDDLVATADAIAARAHGQQIDKAGEPYIGHPRRVAARLREDHPDAPAGVIAAALLHDVLEDTDVTVTELAQIGVPDEVLAAVDAVTKRPGEPAPAYFARVRKNPWAILVKTADIDDNTAPSRVARLDPATRARLQEKYARSRALLAGAEG